MRILTVNHEYPPVGGGGGIVHELIARELAVRHRVVVVTSRFGDLPHHEIRDGVEILRTPVVGRRSASSAGLASLLSYPPGAWLAAWRLFRAERFDVVHGHFAVPGGIGSLPPARLAGIPHVISLHGGDIYDPSKRISPHRFPVVRSAVNWVMRRSDAVVAQSENTKENAYRYYSYRGPIRIVPLGVRQPEYTRVGRAEAGLPAGGFLAVTVGRLVPRKQIDQLIRAIAHPDCHGVHLAIVGDGPERSALESLARELDLVGRVHFTGRVSEERKWQTLSAADLFVSATAHEGFGLVYLEAMATGLPIVTFDEGGHVDFLKEGRHGHLVPLDDVRGLAEAIARVRADPESARRFRENCLTDAPEHHIRTTASAYESLFEELISARRLTLPQG